MAVQLPGLSARGCCDGRVGSSSRDLKSRIDQIDRDCKLTDEQKQKLDVAGHGDIEAHVRSA